MKLVPITLREANAFVALHHRHHPPARGCRFCLGAEVGGGLVAVAIVSRPVARSYDPRTTCEVVRLASDGTRNACSFLYGAARRVAQAMGFVKILTYTLASEPGGSLRAAGYEEKARVKGRSWSCPSRPRTDRHPLQEKIQVGSRVMDCVLCELYGTAQHSAGHPEAPRHGDKDYAALKRRQILGGLSLARRLGAIRPKCYRKKRHRSEKSARTAMKLYDNPKGMNVYQCPGCRGGWHVGNREKVGA